MALLRSLSVIIKYTRAYVRKISYFYVKTASYLSVDNSRSLVASDSVNNALCPRSFDSLLA